MPYRPSVPPRRPVRSTNATPCSSQVSSRPYWAAHKSGPSPPGPPPTTTDESGLSSVTGSAEHIEEHPYDPMHHLQVDRALFRQVDDGRRQFHAVEAGACVYLYV